ncbi:MAG: hypothetical protein ACLQDQ_09970 [Myxococcaceae bacterium]
MGAEAAPLVEAEPSRVVLGAGMQVRITVRGSGGPLHGVASAGTLVPTGDDAGTAHFLWTPPEPRAPFMAVMAFWEGSPLTLGSVTTLTLPCSARTELAIETEPGARVTVEIAGAHFGPRRADGRGKLRMPVEVAPSAHEARITAEVGEEGKVRVVPLPTAPSPWVWAVEPSALAAGTDGQAMLVAPDEIDSHLTLRTTGGQLEREAAEANRVLYRVTPQLGASRVALDAALTGEETSRASATVEVLPASPAAAPATPVAEPGGRQLEVGVALGVFWAGGQNVGPAFAASLAVAPWRFPLYLELELGIRAAWFSNPVPGLGTAFSTLVVFPIDVGVRGPVWSAGPWTVELHAGGGVLLGTNWVSSDFGQGSSGPVAGWEAFGGAQLSYRAGAFLPYAEVRGAYAVVTGTGLTANPGGLLVFLGFHWREGLR